MSSLQADITHRDKSQHYTDHAPEIQPVISESANDTEFKQQIPLLHEYIMTFRTEELRNATDSAISIEVKATKRKHQIVSQREQDKLKEEWRKHGVS